MAKSGSGERLEGTAHVGPEEGRVSAAWRSNVERGEGSLEGSLALRTG